VIIFFFKIKSSKEVIKQLCNISYQNFMTALELGEDTFTLILWKFSQCISLPLVIGWSYINIFVLVVRLI
jgi:hypothetical protein